MYVEVMLHKKAGEYHYDLSRRHYVGLAYCVANGSWFMALFHLFAYSVSKFAVLYHKYAARKYEKKWHDMKKGERKPTFHTD